MKCPVCGKPADKDHKPFCSKSCAEIDLGRWLREDYAIPQPATDEDEADE